MASQCGEGETTKNDKNPSIISYLGEAKEEIPWITRAPFEILHKYGSQVKRFRQGKFIRPISGTTASSSHSQELSAESIVRIAKMRLLQHTSQRTDDFGSKYPFLSQSNLSSTTLKDVELTFSLLNAAEKFSNRQFDCAEKLLGKCIFVSSCADNPVERVVKFFAEALRQRVDIERGKIDLERKTFHIEENLLNYQPVILACEEKLPSSQVTQFAAIQAILDSVGMAKIIHLVDFSIKSGWHWSIMMQGLANRENGPLELLKITAIGSSKDRLEETGKRLSSFAESMKLPFFFKTVVSEMEDLNQDSFKTEADEVVAVYSGLHLWSKLAWPNHLKSFIQFVKKLNPCVIVVNEIEASTNTSIFIDRFHGALSFSIAMFDCLDTCLKGETIYRKIVEEVFFQDMIQNIITAEDEERTHRHAKIGFWRELFAEFNIVETELSASSLYQASLLTKRNANWNSCTLHMDGKCMIVGWKGTPLQSISAWMIHHEKIEHDSA